MSYTSSEEDRVVPETDLSALVGVVEPDVADDVSVVDPIEDTLFVAVDLV